MVGQDRRAVCGSSKEVFLQQFPDFLVTVGIYPLQRDFPEKASLLPSLSSSELGALLGQSFCRTQLLFCFPLVLAVCIKGKL